METSSRDAAIDQVEKAAHEEWLAMAEGIVLSMTEPFTTDDIVERFPPNAPTTHEPRAMGAVMRRLSKCGAIRSTERLRRSTHEQCHNRPKMIWEPVEWDGRPAALAAARARIVEARRQKFEAQPGEEQGSLFGASTSLDSAPTWEGEH